MLRQHALSIWQAALAAADPAELIPAALQDASLPLRQEASTARRIVVVGAGKAAGAMSAALERSLPDLLDRMGGIVNVPSDCVRKLRRIRLHGARPAGLNEPTAEGVEGCRRMLDILDSSGPDDVAVCLLSGGGSALLPAPPDGVSLDEEQRLTRLLHGCGATINEMNAVRKHLSIVKGGRLAERFQGRSLFGLIISDVIGDPLDVIASGPTAPDPTTFGDALTVLEKYGLHAHVPQAILKHLEKGVRGEVPETPKRVSERVRNHVIGNNARALCAAEKRAAKLGYQVINLGSSVDGATQNAARDTVATIRCVLRDRGPLRPPVCLLSGGETTVTLTKESGLGGRNQEFVLTCLAELGGDELKNVLVLSAGTDGEDGPTDAAGALADYSTFNKYRQQALAPARFLENHDAYHFFEKTGDLIKTGLTQTNVMDIHIALIGAPPWPQGKDVSTNHL